MHKRMIPRTIIQVHPPVIVYRTQGIPTTISTTATMAAETMATKKTHAKIALRRPKFFLASFIDIEEF
jgi:hypothetical protein